MSFDANEGEFSEGKIILEFDDAEKFYFDKLETPTRDGYKFIEGKSSKIPKYKYSSDAKEALAPVVDGAIFD